MKTFLVYNTSYFGDTILTDALCRNLKRLYYKEHKNQYVFDAAFVIYGNERGILLSKFLGAKKIYADNRHAIVRLLLSNGKINYGKWIHVQDRHAYLAEL